MLSKFDFLLAAATASKTIWFSRGEGLFFPIDETRFS